MCCNPIRYEFRCAMLFAGEGIKNSLSVYAESGHRAHITRGRQENDPTHVDAMRLLSINRMRWCALRWRHNDRSLSGGLGRRRELKGEKAAREGCSEDCIPYVRIQSCDWSSPPLSMCRLSLSRLFLSHLPSAICRPAVYLPLSGLLVSSLLLTLLLGVDDLLQGAHVSAAVAET